MRCPTCRSELPAGVDVCTECGTGPRPDRADKQRKGRRRVVAAVVILVLAILSCQMAVPLVKELTKTESQRMIVVAKDIGKEWSSTEPAVSEDVYSPTADGDSAHVQLRHVNGTSNMTIDCMLMIYEDNITARLSYEVIGANLSANNMSELAAILGDRSVVFSSEEEGAEGWFRCLLIVYDVYVIYIEAREYGPVESVDLSLLLDMGETQLEKLE